MHLNFHTRKRREPYPSRRAWLRLLDRIVLLVGIAGPLMTLPQIILIFSTHDASGVSPISWLSWSLMDIPWVIYGLVHRETPITITYILWFVGNFTVFIGALLY